MHSCIVLPRERHFTKRLCPAICVTRRALQVGLILLLGFGAIGQVFGPSAAYALGPGDMTITAITPFAAVDSNTCVGGDGPHAMYIQVNVTNNTAGLLSDVSATLNGFPASAASPPSPPTAFTLDLGESTTRLVGSLGAGATAPLYWFVNYPCALPPAGGSSIY